MLFFFSNRCLGWYEIWHGMAWHDIAWHVWKCLFFFFFFMLFSEFAPNLVLPFVSSVFFFLEASWHYEFSHRWTVVLFLVLLSLINIRIDVHCCIGVLSIDHRISNGLAFNFSPHCCFRVKKNVFPILSVASKSSCKRQCGNRITYTAFRLIIIITIYVGRRLFWASKRGRERERVKDRIWIFYS